MTRLDLLQHNAGVVAPWHLPSPPCGPDAGAARDQPVDVLTWHLGSLCPGMRILTLGCSWTMVRFRSLVARAAGVSADSVRHGHRHPRRDSMESPRGCNRRRLPRRPPAGRRRIATSYLACTWRHHVQPHEGLRALRRGRDRGPDRGVGGPGQGHGVPGERASRGGMAADVCLALPCVVADSCGSGKILELDLSTGRETASAPAPVHGGPDRLARGNAGTLEANRMPWKEEVLSW